jgi:predicted ATP-binding protein involved in virulence
MKIRKLHLKNIGVFDDETIKFKSCDAKDKAEIHIFTGQNGSGKTTLLMALASAFRCNPINVDEINFFKTLQNTVNEDILLENSEKKNFITTFQKFLNNIPIPEYSSANSYIQNSELGKRVSAPSNELIISLEFKGHSETISASYDSNLGIFLSNSTSSRTIPQYGRLVSNNDSLPKTHNFDFASFAYSSYRKVDDVKVSGIYENFDWNPLFGSMDFNKEHGVSNFNQWIANNISKSALIKSRNRKIKKDKFFIAIKEVEDFILGITGQKIKFDLDIEPFSLFIKLNGKKLDFDVLPDGLKSLISWIGDLLMRLDSLKWKDNTPIFEREIILFLDEIEVHMHPAWQRKILPVVQKLFKNSQIFVSTHSPFVVNSVDDAWVYELKVENGKAQVAEKNLTKTAYSYQTILREVFDIDERFGEKTQKKLEDFLKQSRRIQQSNGNNEINKDEFLSSARYLASQSAELQSLVFLELSRLSKETGEPYEI